MFQTYGSYTKKYLKGHVFSHGHGDYEKIR